MLAMGSVPMIPEIEGLEEKKAITFREVLRGEMQVKEKVIVLGGGSVGCEVARFLAKKGKKVTIVEMLREVGIDMFSLTKPFYVQSMLDEGIRIFTNVTVERVRDKGLEIVNEKGERQLIESESIVIAVGSKPNKELFEALKGRGLDVFQIGDCVETRRIVDAVREGFLLGCQI